MPSCNRCGRSMASEFRTYLPSRLAQADLEDIYAYTLENWSAGQAETYYARLIGAFNELVAGTKFGRKADVADYLKLLVGAHVIYFRPDGDVIQIVRVLHAAMDAERRLRP